jgi:hypothetical protein
MSRAVTAIASLGVLSALTVGVSESPGYGQPAQTATTQPSTAPMPTHAIRGVVKAMSVSALVITASGKKASVMTFVLSPSTHREGQMTIGATVSVRYRVENQTLLATAVSTHPESAGCRLRAAGSKD